MDPNTPIPTPAVTPRAKPAARRVHPALWVLAGILIAALFVSAMLWSKRDDERKRSEAMDAVAQSEDALSYQSLFADAALAIVKQSGGACTLDKIRANGGFIGSTDRHVDGGHVYWTDCGGKKHDRDGQWYVVIYPQGDWQVRQE